MKAPLGGSLGFNRFSPGGQERYDRLSGKWAMEKAPVYHIHDRH